MYDLYYTDISVAYYGERNCFYIDLLMLVVVNIEN